MIEMGRPRKTANGFLPPHVYRFKSQHGSERLRFMKSGLPSRYFSALFGTKAFWAEYEAFLNPVDTQIDAPKPPRAVPGTLDDLIERYFAVPTRLGPSLVTQAKIRAIIEDFREGRGNRPVALVTFEAIDKIIAKKRVKSGAGNKTKGGVHAAIKLRKELVRLFDFAERIGMCPKNPAKLAEKIKIPAAERSKGFHSWTEGEIKQYRDHHKIGTRERLAMELILWTDQRRCDVVNMGKAQIQGGRIPIQQEKTGKTLWVAVAPQLSEAILAMKPEETSPFCFLVTKRGKSFTKESFGNWFKKACVEAGLPHCSAHGLRKATLRRMAELEMANKTMKSVSGQTRDETLAGYIEDADQVRLSDSAITQLARWEMTNQEGDQNAEYRFTAND